MSLSEHISRVIKSARELKTIADELGNLDLKSQLLEEIDQLQELRESLSESGELAQFTAQSTPSEPRVAHSPEPSSSESATHIIKPSEEGETYQIHVDGDQENEASTDSAIENDRESDNTSEEAERFRRGEAVLRKLEPQQQRILKQMNDILTEEQKIQKQTLTREGHAAGKKGSVIQQEVMAALELTEKQQQLMAVARKELQDIQSEIVQQVDGLLTTEHANDYKKQSSKNSQPVIEFRKSIEHVVFDSSTLIFSAPTHMKEY